MHEECLICGAPLVYLTQDEEMECALCHRRERSKTRCQKGHYVCNTCHTRGLDQLVALCRREESRNPWTILGGSLFFALFKVVASYSTIIPFLPNFEGVKSASNIYQMLPYIVTMILLIFTSKKSRAPKAEGIPYDKGSR